MSNKKLFRMTLAAALAAFGWVQPAAADVEEQEQNHPIQSAQQLRPTGDAIVVKGVIGNLSGAAVLDADFYSFYAQKGDVITVDIDGGIGGARSVDTVLTLFGPPPGYKWLWENDDKLPIDPGSTARSDARIEQVLIQESGVYTVAVTPYRVFFNQAGGGAYRSTGLGSSFPNGDYTLIITGVSPATQQIGIQIKPGSGDFAPLNPKSRGKVPVALLSSTESPVFTPSEVDVKSLRFGRVGTEESLSHCGKATDDLNADGVPDLVCHFENQLAKFERGDLEGILTGATTGGQAFEGRGMLKVVPVKVED